MLEEIDFTVEEIEVELPKMDITKVQSGCWGDSGSDCANIC